jgi:hypothetical protein
MDGMRTTSSMHLRTTAARIPPGRPASKSPSNSPHTCPNPPPARFEGNRSTPPTSRCGEAYEKLVRKVREETGMGKTEWSVSLSLSNPGACAVGHEFLAVGALQ